MKKQYKIQLPKGKKVTKTNVNFEDGVMTVNVELEKNDSNIWDKMIQEYGEAICGKKVQKYEPKDGDFIYLKWKGIKTLLPYEEEEKEAIAIFKGIKKCGGINGLFCYVTYLSNDGLDGKPLFIYDNMNGYECSLGDVSMYDEIRPATEIEKTILINKLAEKGKRWNEKEKRIEDIEYIPQNGDIVTMPMVSDLANFLKAKKYIAIYKREDIEAEKIYCYFIIGQHRNGDTFVFEEDHITDNGTMISEIKLATEEEKYLLFDKLAESGKRWNEETKQIEDVRWRAKEGEKFYYIGADCIIGCMERFNTHYLWRNYDNLEQQLEDERYNNFEYKCWKKGNYFKTREAAEKAAEQIRNIFKSSKEE